MKICDLDDDPLLVVFSFLPVKAILAMRQVCRLQDFCGGSSCGNIMLLDVAEDAASLFYARGLA